MTAPSYTEDLEDITLAISTTDWAEGTAAGYGDGGVPDADTDFPFIQGSVALSQTMTKATICSMMFNAGGDIDHGTDGAYFIWQAYASPMAATMDTIANGGMRVIIGSSTADFYVWFVGGNDFARNPYGGWINHVVNTTITPDDQEGTPSGTEQYIGAAIKSLAGISKGQPHQIDAMRYGRGSSIFEYGEAADYCTFAGFAALNDNNDNRWGLIQEVAGGYLYKGKLTLGSTNPCDFRDTNVFILIDDTPKVTANFNTIEVNHADSRVDWTNVIFKALGTTSPGRWVTNANADLNIVACQFFNMGAFSFGGSNSEFTGCIWNNCGQVTQAGATLVGCTFVESTAAVALAAADLTLVSGCDFTSGGTGYAIEGFSAAGSYTLTNLTFTGYASSDGSTGNEALHVLASAGTVTINYTGAAPSVHSAGATIVKVGSSVDITVTVKTAAGANVAGALVYLRASDGSGPFPFQELVTIVNSGTTATVTHAGHGMASNDYVSIKGASLLANNGVFQITVTGVDGYTYTMGSTPGSSPTGTITSTFVALYGTSSAGGVVTTSREYGDVQPVVGWARKSTSAPYYKSAPLVGEVDDVDGYSATAVMILDQ